MLRAIDWVTDQATGWLLLVASLMTFAMVATRYLLAWSDPSVEILARYMMIWAAFLGVAAAVRHDINIRFTLLEEFLGLRWLKVFRTIGNTVAMALALGLGVSGLSLVDETRMFNEVMPTALRWPIWIFHAAVPVGAFLLAFQLLVRTLRMWRGSAASADRSPAS